MINTPLANSSMPKNYFRAIIKEICEGMCAKIFTTKLFIIGIKCTIENWLNKLVM